MSKYPIEVTSIAFNDIKDNIKQFVQSKPDASRWRDFYTGSEGTILIELMAGYQYYTALKILFSREATYLAYANTLLDARAIAQNLAYSAFRGTNRRYKVRIVPNQTVAIPAFTVIGYQGDYDFITLEDLYLNEDEETVIYGAVGVFNSASIEAPSSDLHVFRFNDESISNDYKLYLNDVEVPTTSVSREALEDNYLVQSNAVGGVNVTYLNMNEDFQHRYQTRDILRLDYIRFQNIPYATEIHIDYAREAEIIATENTVAQERLESVQTKAPIMFETQQLIRGREDYVKNLLDLGPKFVDTSGRDLSAAYVELTYVQNDRMIMSESEENEIFSKLTYGRMLGIPLPYINKPRYMKLPLNINLKLTTSGLVQAQYNEIVDKVFDDYTYKFSDFARTITFDLAELARLLEKQDNVKRADVTNFVEDFKPNGYYEIGDVFYNSAHPEVQYRVTNVTYTTGNEEPSWNYELGSITEDGKIQWQAVPQSGHPKHWVAKDPVELYALRIPSEVPKDMEGIMFRAVKGRSVSDVVGAPEFNTSIGDITYDNELIWMCVEYLATAPKWEINSWYNLGDIVSHNGSSFQVIGERRRVPAAQPNMTDEPDKIFYSNLILTKEVLEDEKIELPWGLYVVLEPKITVGV